MSTLIPDGTEVRIEPGCVELITPSGARVVFEPGEVLLQTDEAKYARVDTIIYGYHFWHCYRETRK